MKKVFFIILLLLCGLQNFAQKEVFNYDNFFYYRNHLYLQTPSSLLNAAGDKIIAGDTAAAIQLIKEAAEKNMYDTGYISFSRLKFITKRKEWPAIRTTIQKNREALSDPGKMQVITSDVERFWKIFDKITQPGGDRLLMNEYIMKGSQGLRTFFEVRMELQVTNIIETVRARKKYFESIRPVSMNLHTLKPRIIEAAGKLKALYPAAIFPPTTFTIGTFTSFGTPNGGSGQLIGAEFICDTNTVVKDELDNWERAGIADSSRILGIIIHELIHIEQETASPKTLLAKSINEGAADFITQLVLGYNLNSKMHAYGNAHEKELWEKFKQQMNGEKTNDWLYNGSNAKGFPADLGYYMGYKICEAYYNKATDKKQAVKDILTIRDFAKFLEQSGYPENK